MEGDPAGNSRNRREYALKQAWLLHIAAFR